MDHFIKDNHPRMDFLHNSLTSEIKDLKSTSPHPLSDFITKQFEATGSPKDWNETLWSADDQEKLNPNPPSRNKVQSSDQFLSAG